MSLELCSFTNGRMPRTLVVFLLLPCFISACSTARTIDYKEAALVRAAAEVPDAERLDVGIILFDPGTSADSLADEKKLIFPDVRQAEARYMPYHLKTTLESSGYWGSVWVVPQRSDAVDLTVTGRIDLSDGLDVSVHIGAWDATGREWLNKAYTVQVPEKAYSKIREPGQDPYQTLYNEIANDLLAIRQKMSASELRTLRNVAELRYGAQLVPEAFAGLLEQDRAGIYKLRRLPATDDPMVSRMHAVREREYTLVDTLNEYYANLYYEIGKPYEDWRKMSREEVIRYRDLKRSAFVRGSAGALAILAAIIYEGSGGDNSAITMTGVMGGIEGIKSGLGKNTEANVSRESLKELGGSFNSEAESVVVEVEGQTRRLTGTAEERYQEWRRLLREIYSAETGTPGVDAAEAAVISPPAG
ncbi:MAG: hypothetical protein KDI87_05635 [Gammaproteobacteria bacterium]|nr:hypothetical protein [Gammaproteobacteria bacterium]MCP5140215.1 hypothetical protein [Chromatiales bacterium]